VEDIVGDFRRPHFLHNQTLGGLLAADNARINSSDDTRNPQGEVVSGKIIPFDATSIEGFPAEDRGSSLRGGFCV